MAKDLGTGAAFGVQSDPEPHFGQLTAKPSMQPMQSSTFSVSLPST